LDHEDLSPIFIPINSIESLAGHYDSLEVTSQLIDRLRDAGYRTLQRIVVLGAQKVSDDIRVSMKDAQRICSLANTKIREFEIQSAPAFSDLPGQYPSMVHIRTGSKVLDSLLGGGIEVGALTELFGRSGSGKTQLCHTISVTSQTSPDLQYPTKNNKVGKFSKVIYIDTEGTFRPERVTQIARARGLREDKVVRNIHVIYCLTVFEQEQCLKLICELLDKDKSISVIIIDSIIVHFRAEYPWRSVLPERQQRLNKYLSTLSKVARVYKVAVVITNQVQSIPSDTADSHHDDISTGGNILSHISTHRIRLNKPFSENIYAKVVKSPYHSSSAPDARFTITNKGIDDLEDELNMLFRQNENNNSI